MEHRLRIYRTSVVLLALAGFTPVYAVDTIENPAFETIHGDAAMAANRVDMVILGDGYTQAELSGQYATDVNNMTNAFFGANNGTLGDPFYRYRNFFNVHKVGVASNESGLDLPEADTPVYKDTALDGKLVGGRLIRFSRSLGDTAVDNALAGTGIDVDTSIGVVNTSLYGGVAVSGGGSRTWGFFSGSNNSTPSVARHEVGHSFAGLADEYDYGGDATYTGSEPTAVNVTTDPTGAKWSEWLGYTDELGTIGAFEGGRYSQFGIYRPTASSKMRVLNTALNAVSREQVINKIYDNVKPLDVYTDNSVALHKAAGANAGTLLADVVDTDVIKLQWMVDGQLIANTGESLDLEGLALTNGHHTVTVRAYDEVLDFAYSGDVTMDWVRTASVAAKLDETVSWDIYTGVDNALLPLLGDRISAVGSNTLIDVQSGSPLQVGDYSTGNGYDLTRLRFGGASDNAEVQVSNNFDLAGQTLSVDVLDNTASEADVTRLQGNLTGGNVTKTGGGRVKLEGTNSLAELRVNGGVVELSDGGNSVGSGNIVLDGGDLHGKGSLVRTLGTDLVLTNGNIGARDGVFNLDLAGGGTHVGAQGERLVLGSTTANNELRVTNGFTLGGGSATAGTDSFEVEVLDNAQSNDDIVHLSGLLGSGVLEKFGDGALHVSNVGADVSKLIVRQGAIDVNSVTDLNGKRVVLYGGVLQTHGTLDPDSFVSVAFQGDGENVSGGFSARTGKLTVDYGRDVQYRRAVTGLSAGGSTLWGPLRLSSKTADNEVELTNNVNMNGRVMDIYVDDNTASEGDFGHISGNVSNGSIAKRGAGRLKLTGSIVTTEMLIEEGMLDLEGSASTSGSGSITINGGHFKTNSSVAVADVITFTSGTLSGTGEIASAVSVGANANLAPGNSPGNQLFSGGLTFNNSGTYQWEINDFGGAQGTDPGWDHIDVTGGWDISNLTTGGFTIDVISLALSNLTGLASGFNELLDYSFNLLSFDSIVGSFSSSLFVLDLGNFQNSFTGIWSLAVIGNDFQLNYDGLGPAVPLPGGLWLILAGILMLLHRCFGLKSVQPGQGSTGI